MKTPTIGLCLCGAAAICCALPDVSVQDGALWADGRPFIVRGIAYGGWLCPDLRGHGEALQGADLRRMGRLGFNLVKQWGPIGPGLLDACERHGLYVLNSVNANSEYPRHRHEAFVAGRLQEIEQDLLPHDGRSVVLGWNLGSELHDGDWRARSPEITHYLQRALLAFRARSRRPVTYANLMSAVDDLDLSGLDIYGLQVYIHSRPQLRRFLNHVRRRLAPGQPLLVTEFGTASCYPPSGWGRAPLDQGLGYEMQWQEIMRAGAVGGVLFQWSDEWYKGPPGNDPDVQDEHSEEHFGLLEAGRRPKPALAHVARMWGALRVMAEPKRLVIPRVATLYVAPRVDPLTEALTDEAFHLSLATYLPMALPGWRVVHTPALDGSTAVVLPGLVDRDPQAVGALIPTLPALGPGEGVIVGGETAEQPTVLAGGDGYGLLAAMDAYLDRWRQDPHYRRRHVTVVGGGHQFFPPGEFFVDFGPDEETEAIVVSQWFLWGEDPTETAEAVARGAGLFVIGGWGTYGGHGETRPGWAGTVLEDMLPVTVSPGPDAVNLDGPATPQLTEPDHPLAPFVADFPPVYGYNRETARANARVILALGNGQPLLVAGEYGRGRVLCLLTSIGPSWGRAVQRWPGLERFYRACVDWVTRRL